MPLSVTIRVKLFCLVEFIGYDLRTVEEFFFFFFLLFYLIVYLVSVSPSTVRPSDIQLIAANIHLKSSKEHSAPWRHGGDYQNIIRRLKCAL